MSPTPARPYWHVDAKWITGLLLLLTLSLTLLAFDVFWITSEPPAVEVVTQLVASMFSRGGLDDESEIQEVHQRLREDPDGEIQPIPGMPLVVRERDIAGMSPREIRFYIFRQLAEPLYWKGPEGLAAMIGASDDTKEIQGQVGVLGLFTRENNQKIKQVMLILAGASAVLVGLLAFFSYRWGRLGSPGCALFLASLPNALLLGLPLSVLTGRPPASGAEEDGTAIILTNISSTIIVDVFETLLRYAAITALIGAGLLAASVLGALIGRVLSRRKAAAPVAAQSEIPAGG